MEVSFRYRENNRTFPKGNITKGYSYPIKTELCPWGLEKRF